MLIQSQYDLNDILRGIFSRMISMDGHCFIGPFIVGPEATVTGI